MTQPNMTRLAQARAQVDEMLLEYEDIIGERDCEALRLVLATLDARTEALQALVGPAGDVYDDLDSLLDTGILADDQDRDLHVHANLDDLARHIHQAEKTLAE